MTGAPGDLRGIIPRVNEALHGAIHLGVSSAIGGYYSIAEWFISSKIRMIFMTWKEDVNLAKFYLQPSRSQTWLSQILGCAGAFLIHR
jgi:hypothetical protein